MKPTTDHSPSGKGSEVSKNLYSDTRTESSITADTSTTHDSSDRERHDVLLGKYLGGRITEDQYYEQCKADREAAVLEGRIKEHANLWEVVPMDAEHVGTVKDISELMVTKLEEALKEKENKDAN